MYTDLKFYQPDKLNDAVELLAAEKLRLLAGGTDFMVDFRADHEFLAGFDGILDISRLDGLKGLKEKDGLVEIGALVTHQELVESKLINQYFPALAQAAAAVGSTQIRNRGTIGGNICNAAACADTLGPLIAFEGRVVLQSAAGRRTMDVIDFVTRPYQTERREDEILVSFLLPIPEKGTYSGFEKIGRRQALAITRISLVVMAKLSDEGIVEAITLAPGSATPVPAPFKGVEAKIKGKQLANINAEEIGEQAAQEMVSITGERWSTPYKKPALATLFRRAIIKLQEEVASNE